MIRIFVFSAVLFVIVCGLPEHYKDRSPSAKKSKTPNICLILKINTEESGCNKQDVHTIKLGPNIKNPKITSRSSKNCSIGQHLTSYLYDSGDIVKTHPDGHDDYSSESYESHEAVPTKPPKVKPSASKRPSKPCVDKFSKSKLIKLIEEIYNKTKQLDLSDSKCDDNGNHSIETTTKKSRPKPTKPKKSCPFIHRPAPYKDWPSGCDDDESGILSEEEYDPHTTTPAATLVPETTGDTIIVTTPAAGGLKPFRRNRYSKTRSPRKRPMRKRDVDSDFEDDDTDSSEFESNDENNSFTDNTSCQNDNTSWQTDNTSTNIDNISADTDNISAHFNNKSADIDKSESIGEHSDQFLSAHAISSDDFFDQLVASRIARASTGVAAGTSAGNRLSSIRSGSSAGELFKRRSDNHSNSSKQYLREKSILARLTKDKNHFVDSAEADHFYDLYNKFSKKIKVIFGELSDNKLRKNKSSNDIRRQKKLTSVNEAKSLKKDTKTPTIIEIIAAEKGEKSDSRQDSDSTVDISYETDGVYEENEETTGKPIVTTADGFETELDSATILGGKTIVFGKGGPKLPLSFVKDELGRLHVILDGSCLCASCSKNKD